MTNNLVSIIIPLFNKQDSILRCLSSIKRQTYSLFEVIVVDDGSTDESVNLCRNFILGDSRFILLSKENGGVSSARNFGLKHINGEYFVFIDADDYVEEPYLENLLYSIKQSNEKICFCSYKTSKNNEIFLNSFLKSGSYNLMSLKSFKYETCFFARHVWSAIFHYSLSYQTFDTTLHYGEDAYYISLLLEITNFTFCYSDNPHYIYVDYECSASHGIANPSKRTFVNSWNNIARVYSKCNKDIEKDCYVCLYLEGRNMMRELFLHKKMYSKEEWRSSIKYIGRSISVHKNEIISAKWSLKGKILFIFFLINKKAFFSFWY